MNEGTTHDLRTFYDTIATKVPMLFLYQFLVTIVAGKTTVSHNGVTYDSDFSNDVDWDTLQLLCQSGGIPQNTIGTADVNFFGKNFHVPTVAGQQHEWSTKIILTNDMRSYNELRKLVLKFSSLERNMGGIRNIPNLDIIVDVLDQFSLVKKGQPRIVLKGAFPTKIDAVNLKYDENSQTITPGVTFTYQYSYFDMPHDRLNTDSLNHNAKTGILGLT